MYGFNSTVETWRQFGVNSVEIIWTVVTGVRLRISWLLTRGTVVRYDIVYIFMQCCRSNVQTVVPNSPSYNEG